ncbi:non-homologous end-joining DNA ligase [Nocardioides caldifontis]|uniref:non-homologous end-joining DNA ligase n=1 Tax=Nocardioides caldifontis TaxID=2588938 RepID=UPI0011E00277|nr:non-homologous end-joining DNA ligase [Nocardioides caldifontis]
MAEASAEVRVEVDGRKLTVSNLDKVLYPETGTTKGEVLHYYAQVAPVLLPHLADRAVTRIRWPHGTHDKSFFEKNAPQGAPSWLRTARVPTTGSRGESRYGDHLLFPVVESLADLTYLANLASIELHVHQWKVDDEGQPLNPDRMVIDLDPGHPAGLQECAQVALLVRDRLSALGLSAAPVLSGSKGLHLYAPMPGTLTADQVRDAAKQIAEALEKEEKLVISQMTKAKRSGKVFLDWSQNTGSKTTICPYSLRGKERPYVAAPLTWEEVEEGAEEPGELQQLTYDEVLERVDELGDVFAELMGGG